MLNYKLDLDLIRGGIIKMQTWEYYWEAIINLLESSLFLLFIENHLSPRIIKSSKLTFIIKIVFVVIDSLLTDIMNFNGVNTAAKILSTLAIYILFTSIFYYNSPFPKILFPCLFSIFLLLADSITFLITCFFIGGDFNELIFGGLLRIPATLLYILSIAIFVFILHFLKKKDPNIPVIKKYLYFIYCLIGLLFCIYISAVTVKSYYLFKDTSFTNSMIIISSFFTIIFFLLLAYIYNLGCEKEKNQQLSLERQQLMLEEAEYKSLLELTASLRLFKHDVQHHLDAIKYISHNGSTSELDDYISNFIGEINDAHKFISSGNTAIDSVLTSKIPLAESLGISVTYSLSIPDEFNINPVNITTILGNLWNNSIEACEKLHTCNNSSISPIIDFYIKPIQNMLLISIENTFDGYVSKNENGIYMSTKTDNNNHGFGLQRVIDITKKNDGFIDITTNDNMFCVHIMFPIKGASTL